MSKITIIGAGSVMFTRQIVSALLSYPAMAGTELVLMDLNPEVLTQSHRLITMMVAQSGLPMKVSQTTSQRDAIRHADFVSVPFRWAASPPGGWTWRSRPNTG